MNELRHSSTLSAEAKARMLGLRGEPFFYAHWHEAVFLHYAVKPEVLQPFVPFELDVFANGMAYVSCVAFTMKRLRPRMGGEWLFKPIATHEFLNVRAYVKHGGVKGIYFLAEWLPNKLNVLLGPTVFGLPYRLGVNQYEHQVAASLCDASATNGPTLTPSKDTGHVVTLLPSLRGYVADCASGRTLRYEADITSAPHVCDEGTLEEFLIERYTAFTTFLGLKRCFHVWHPPWRIASLDARILDDSLLRCTGDWAQQARFVSAHVAGGFDDVWMGRPRFVLRNSKLEVRNQKSQTTNPISNLFP